MGQLEARMETRFAQVGARFEQMEARMDARFAQMENRLLLKFGGSGHSDGWCCGGGTQALWVRLGQRGCPIVLGTSDSMDVDGNIYSSVPDRWQVASS